MKQKTKKRVVKVFMIIALVALVAAAFVPPIYYIITAVKSHANSGTSLAVSLVEQTKNLIK